MLLQLQIKDFALIENLTLTFDEQLNVLTGETGAGKSIIIDAVSLLLGARANSEDIRVGCQKAIIEGVFYLDQRLESLIGLLNDMGIEIHDDRLVILAREISATGKNLCRMNNRMITLANFKEIGHQLVNIYGQHDFQAISNPDKHIELLDSLGDKTFKQLKMAVKEQYAQLKQAKDKVQQLLNMMDSRNERLEFLRFKTHEIDELNLTVGEDDKLDQEVILLDNQEKIVGSAVKAYRLLYGENASAYALISKSISHLGQIAQYDPSIELLLNNLKESSYVIEDIGLTLAKYEDQFDFDPKHKEQVNERKYVLDRLKKKYLLSLAQIIEENDHYKLEISQLENVAFEIDQAKQQLQQEKIQYQEIAQQLTEARQQLAKAFELQLVENLKELAMNHALFEVKITTQQETVSGHDHVEFYISPNPGQPLKPLSQIASGGEMSRIMLAFKTILSKFEAIGTLIFDEIDAGIGGNILVKVADKLHHVSIDSQVICVTHAPQIAALAQKHFKISKFIKEDTTITEVTDLDTAQQIEEIARMLGGQEEYHLKHAEELKKLKCERDV